MADSPWTSAPLRDHHRGMTLLEILVVTGIIGLLIAMLLPSLNKARVSARSLVCATQLRNVMIAVLEYASENDDAVVPSYNMRGLTGGRSNPLDGWPTILDQDGHLPANGSLKNNPLICPETEDDMGLAATQRGNDTDNPRGYVDWPLVMTFTRVYARPIQSRGIDKIIRSSYWINAQALIGAPRTIEPGVHFSTSVGYGPDLQGRVAKQNNFRNFSTPARLIAFADGIFAGKQESPRAGDVLSRIGYRHAGGVGTANVALADGHVESIRGDRFPRKMDSGLNFDEIKKENSGSTPTTYANPKASLERYRLNHTDG